MSCLRRSALLPSILLAGLAASCSPDDRPLVPPGARGLARTAAILANRSPGDRVLRILFYGQSISTTKWTDQAVAGLHRRFPGTRLVVANLAIGGFASQLLERTVERDVASVYPDLIVFHVYGDHRAYERIIRIMRAKTAAEIIVQTDHVIQPVEPLCDEGLHLAWTPPPGCRGHIWFRQNSWEQHMSSAVIPGYARKYGLALEDRRPLWNAYLRRHGLLPQQLLEDGLHPNSAGWQLMARLWVDYMQRQVAAWHGQSSTLVTALPAPAADRVQIPLDGNRVELIADSPLDGQVHAAIDGKPTTAQDGCWQTSRTDSVPGVPEWPLIRQVGVKPAIHRTDRWTATITAFDPATRKFAFSLASDRRGADGAGDGATDFTSPSGEITIDAEDWVIPAAYEMHGVTLPVGYRIGWRRDFVCRDTPVVDIEGRQVEVRHVVATGMANGKHVLTLRTTAAARRRIREIRVYRPPLAVETGA